MTIADFLDKLELSQYLDIFNSNDITIHELSELSEQDLKDIGISSLGHRKKLVKAIASLITNPPGETTSSQVHDGSTSIPWIESLPYMIQESVHNWYTEPNPVIRLWQACDALEMLTRYIVLIRLGEHHTGNTLDAKILHQIGLDLQRPTFGKWIGIATTLLKHAPTKDAIIFQEMEDFVNTELFPLVNGREDRTPQGSFLALRNHLAHSGGVTQKHATHLLEIWKTKLDTLFQKAALFGQGQLVTIASNNLLRIPHKQCVQENISFGQTGEVYVVRENRMVKLWPLMIFAPITQQDGEQSTENFLQIYIRRGDIGIQLLPMGSEDVLHNEMGAEIFTEFQNLFSSNLPSSTISTQKKYVIRDFYNEFNKEHQQIIGREHEKQAIHQAIQHTQEGLIWIGGYAGSGKSCLMGSVITEIHQSIQQTNTTDILLAYKFKRGDDRCAQDAFLTFCIERLEEQIHLDISGQKSKVSILRQLLQHADSVKILFLLDGVDELANIDEQFVSNIIINLQYPNVLWVCSGRPEFCLEKIWNNPDVNSIFPHHLPPLDKATIRNMLLEKIGYIRKKLLIKDVDTNDQVTNPFIENICKNSEGYPLYVTYVIRDILAGRIKELNIQDLPPSLSAYHQELIKRAGVGSLQQIMTPIIAFLAIAHESLSDHFLASLFLELDLLPVEKGEEITLIRKALFVLSSMLKTDSTPDQHLGYGLFHHSMRQQILLSEDTKGSVLLARRQLQRVITKYPYSTDTKMYLYRQGVSHLLQEKASVDALSLLCSLEYLVHKIDALGAKQAYASILQDWYAIGQHTELSTTEKYWKDFFQQRAYNIVRLAPYISGSVVLPILLREEGAVLHTQVENQAINFGSWRISQQHRRIEMPQSACIDTMNTINWITSIAKAANSPNLYVAQKSGYIQVFDMNTSLEVTTYNFSNKDLRSVSIDQKERYLCAVYLDDTAIVWNLDKRCGVEIPAQIGPLQSLTILPTGDRLLGTTMDRVVLWTLDNTILWTASHSDVVQSIVDAAQQRVYCITSSGHIILIDYQTGDTIEIIPTKHQWNRIAISPDAQTLVVGSIDGVVGVMNIREKNISYISPHPERITALLATNEHIFIGYSENIGSLSVIQRDILVVDIVSHDVIRTITGHDDRVTCFLAHDKNTHIISASSDSTVRIWDITSTEDAYSQKGDALYIGRIKRGNSEHVLVTSDDGHIRVIDACGNTKTMWKAYDNVAWDVVNLGHRFATVGEEPPIRIFSQDGILEREWPAYEAISTQLSYGKASGQLCSVGMDHDDIIYIRVWNPDSQELLYQCTGDVVIHATDQQSFFVADEHSITLYNQNLEIVWQNKAYDDHLLPYKTTIKSICVSPNGQWVATGNEQGVISLYDAYTGVKQHSWLAHRWDERAGDYIRGFDFTLDSSKLVSGSDSGCVLLWDVFTYQCLALGCVANWVTALLVINDNMDVLVGTSNGHIRLLEYQPHTK